MLLSTLLLTSCGRTLNVETVEPDCRRSECDFVGLAGAEEMARSGDREYGEWYGWLDTIRAALARVDVEDWAGCHGEVTTATYAGLSEDGRPAGEPPIVMLSIARWRDGQIACTGELGIPGVAFPNQSSQLPGPGDVIEVRFPDVGATFELDA